MDIAPTGREGMGDDPARFVNFEVRVFLCVCIPC